ncbi:thioesterase II family protein [Puniceibacterium confluentis]|uniref:thioesterase II family protein n=1 Tax=Puniceibacterium confluentis TaxID=1958944 RepID=UPI003569613A
MRDLICLPYAGGGTSIFHPWTQQAGPGLRVCPVCLPGREGRIGETPFARMSPLLDWLETHLEASWQRPHILFGHSMGGIVAYALCLRRMRFGRTLPQALVVSACRPPPVRRDVQMHRLGGTELRARLRAYDPANLAYDTYPELWDLMEPVLRADLAVIETFDPGQVARLPIPVIALSGLQDPLVASDDMAGWSDAGCAFDHHRFDGGHFFLRDAPAAVLHRMTQSLCELTGAPAPPG